MNNKTI